MKVAPVLKIFSLVDGQIHINKNAAQTYGGRERLQQPNFDLDNLTIWNRVLSAEESGVPTQNISNRSWSRFPKNAPA